MILQRCVHAPSGIFGQLLDSSGARIAFTLEHAYQEEYQPWMPKVPSGNYECVRGPHHLPGFGTTDFFEITNVPGHTDILFHVGNYNKDSEGCVLLGADIENDMLVKSLETFRKFMKSMEGINSFQLEVR